MQDRVPIAGQENNVLLNPVPGEANTFDLVRDDGANNANQGLVLNKAFWLQDNTADAIFGTLYPDGKDHDSVLISDAWIRLANNVSQSVINIGDIVWALRSPDVDNRTKNRWLPCNSNWDEYKTNVKYPALDDMLTAVTTYVTKNVHKVTESAASIKTFDTGTSWIFPINFNQDSWIIYGKCQDRLSNMMFTMVKNGDSYATTVKVNNGPYFQQQNYAVGLWWQSTVGQGNDIFQYWNGTDGGQWVNAPDIQGNRIPEICTKNVGVWEPLCHSIQLKHLRNAQGYQSTMCPYYFVPVISFYKGQPFISSWMEVMCPDNQTEFYMNAKLGFYNSGRHKYAATGANYLFEGSVEMVNYQTNGTVYMSVWGPRNENTNGMTSHRANFSLGREWEGATRAYEIYGQLYISSENAKALADMTNQRIIYNGTDVVTIIGIIRNLIYVRNGYTDDYTVIDTNQNWARRTAESGENAFLLYDKANGYQIVFACYSSALKVVGCLYKKDSTGEFEFVQFTEATTNAISLPDKGHFHAYVKASDVDVTL
jgi:hypothetical protein